MLPSSDDAFSAALRLRRFRRHFASAHQVRTEVARRPPHDSATPPRWLRPLVRVAPHTSGPWPSYVVTPRTGSRSERPSILYFHGGAYVQTITPWHWAFIARLARATDSTVTVPLYPLAPDSTVLDTVPAGVEIAATFLGNGGGPHTIMGDSAGAGLALAVAQEIRDSGTAPPDLLVLVSPWVDVGLSHPPTPDAVDRDRILGPRGLAEAGRLYAGGAGTEHVWASPILRSMSDLPKMLILTGSRDILNSDAHRLADAATESGSPIALFDAAGGQHDYPLFPTAAGRAGFRTLVTALTEHQLDTTVGRESH